MTGSDADGLYRTRKDYKHLHTMLLPVPAHRKEYASRSLAGDSRLEVELLFRDNLITKYCDKKSVPGGGKILQFCTKMKKDFWRESVKFKKEDFDSFRPLFARIDKFFGTS